MGRPRKYLQNYSTLTQKLASPKITLLTIALIILCLIPGSMGTEGTKVRILSSGLLIPLSLVFLLNLACCTLRQGMQLIHLSNGTLTTGSKSRTGSISVSGSKSTTLSGTATRGNSATRCTGSFALHLGLLIMTCGLILQGQLGQKQDMLLEEGGPPQQIRDSRVFAEELVQQTTEREHGQAKPKILVAITQKDGAVQRSWVEKGNPLFNGISSIHYNTFGYVAYFTRKDGAGGNEIWRVRLHPSGTEGRGTEGRPVYAGEFGTVKSNTVVFMDLLPGNVRPRNGPPGNVHPKEAKLHLTVQVGKTDNRKSQTLQLGQSITLPEKQELVFENYVPLLSLQYRYEPGRYVIFGGLFIAIPGMFLLYLPVTSRASVSQAYWQRTDVDTCLLEQEHS